MNGVAEIGGSGRIPGPGRWLHAAAGGHDLLLDGERSLYIWTADIPGGTVEWQGRELPVVDLSALLAPAAAAAASGSGQRALIAYGAGREDPQAQALAVDAVRGFAALAPEEVAALPPLSAAFAGLFDGIAVVPLDGKYPLCMRRDLDPAVLRHLAVTRGVGGGGLRAAGAR